MLIEKNNISGGVYSVTPPLKYGPESNKLACMILQRRIESAANKINLSGLLGFESTTHASHSVCL